MSQPTVSVIIPAYNCAEFIEESIESVFGQKDSQNIELIIINDGSTDDTLKICKSMVLKYDNLIVLEQVNKGPSSARNHGLSHAKGEFIVFVDSDDVMERDMLSTLLSLIKDDVELGVAAYYLDFIEGDKCNIELVPLESGKYIVSDSSFGRVCCEWYGKHILTTLCNKIYRRDIIEEKHLRFDEEMSISEDLLWNINYLKHVKKIVSTEKGVYHYRIRKNRETVTHRFNQLHVQMQLKVAREMIAFLQSIQYYGNEICYLSLKYITSSLCNIYYEKSWSRHKKRKFITAVMNEGIVEQLSDKAEAAGSFSNILIQMYRNKNLVGLEALLKMLYVFRRYFHVLQRKIMKLLKT